MNINELTLKLFNVVLDEGQNASVIGHFQGMVETHGLLLDFVPTSKQKSALEENHKPLDVTTLFSVAQREKVSASELISIQLCHYLETYGLDSPGLFNLEFSDGQIQTLKYVKMVSSEELAELICNLVYANAPIKDSEEILNLIKSAGTYLEFEKIRNNETRVMLFNPNLDRFDNGDDAVRWMCYAATGSPLLIKSPEVIESVKDYSDLSGFPYSFFAGHESVLAKVFNRHKAIILAAKNMKNRSSINKISRMSKTHHVPMKESKHNSFISRAMKGEIERSDLDSMPLRTKFKILNLLEYKLVQSTTDVFMIRNGKTHVRQDRKIMDKSIVQSLINLILFGISKDLSHLKEQNILIDSDVDYGLLVSRKQCIGNLPYGTRVTIPDHADISSGIYWHNDGGARDLDLSTIDISGNRVGWGQMSGYDGSSGVLFSGDVTNAPTGAMEFMTSSATSYGLINNIYSGEIGSSFELVIGSKSDGRWITDIKIREKSRLDSRNCVIGFVINRTYIAYMARTGSSHYSFDGRDKALIAKGLASSTWTLSKVLDSCGISYDTEYDTSKEYNHDLRYEGFSVDKLEKLLDTSQS